MLFDRAMEGAIENQLPEHSSKDPKQDSQATTVHEVAGQMPPVHAAEFPDWVIRNRREPWMILNLKIPPPRIVRAICVSRIRPIGSTKPAEVVGVEMWKFVFFGQVGQVTGQRPHDEEMLTEEALTFCRTFLQASLGPSLPLWSACGSTPTNIALKRWTIDFHNSQCELM